MQKNMWAKRFELLHLSISRPKRDALDHSAKPTQLKKKKLEPNTACVAIAPA